MSQLISESRNFSEVTRLPSYFKKSWLEATLKEIKINQQSYLSIDEPEKVNIVTPCMDVNKAKIQYGGSIDKLKLRIVVRGD